MSLGKMLWGKFQGVLIYVGKMSSITYVGGENVTKHKMYVWKMLVEQTIIKQVASYK
jgi:hypothetical protein